MSQTLRSSESIVLEWFGDGDGQQAAGRPQLQLAGKHRRPDAFDPCPV
jgi:hypothetical protein